MVVVQKNETPDKDLTAKVLDLAGLVEYQPGSVVSREIFKRNTSNITVFAFDEGQGLSEHTAPFDATVCVLDGVAEITVVGKAHTVKKGEMIIMPANKPHSLKAVEKFKMMLIMIRT